MAPNMRQGQAGTPAVAHARMANAIRALAMDAVQAANSGHPGMPMGMADLAMQLILTPLILKLIEQKRRAA